MPTHEFRTTLTVLACVAAVVFASDARAYCRETTESAADPSFDPSEERSCGDASNALPIFWPSPCIEYRVVVEPELTAARGLTKEVARAIVSRAASAWTEAGCERTTGGPRSPLITLVDVDAGRCNAGPRGTAAMTKNEIRFRASGSPAGSHGSALLALTSNVYDGTTGALKDAQIEVFNRPLSSGPEDDETYHSDLHAVVRHELGHFLGLAHSEKSDATMYAFYDGTASAGLSNDDVRGICNVYPPDAPIYGGCATSREPSDTASSVYALIGIASALVFARRRRKRFALR